MTNALTSTETLPADRMSARDWAVLFVLCGALFLEGLDVSMIGVSLPSIRDDLGLRTSTLQWVVSAYVLGYGGFLMLGGRAADLFGRRRMFLGWLCVFLVASGLGGLAQEGWQLILSRFITGASAAFLTPAGLSIITTTFPEGPLRNKALMVYAGIAAGGFSLGMVAGGLLTEVSWRLVFFVPVFVSGLVLIAALRVLPRSNEEERVRQSFDLAGAVVLTTAMLLLVYAVVEAPEVGWGALQTIALLVLSVSFLSVFVVIEGRTSTPLLRLGLLRSGNLVRANLGAMSLTGAFIGFQFIAVFYLQQIRGWSPIETGVALAPLGIDTILAWTLTPRLVNRFGLTKVISAGLLLGAVACLLFFRIDLGSPYAGVMLPTILLTGLAFALAYGPLTIAATNGVAPREQGVASGLVNTSFQFGAALGLAIATAVITSQAGAEDAVTLDALRTALVVPVLILLFGAGVVATGLLTGRPGELEEQPA